MTHDFTPGEWTTDGDQIYADQEDANDGFLVARSFGSDQIANARLMAASKVLLEALEGLVENTVGLYSAIAHGNAEAGQNFANNDPRYAAARAAIKQATGE